MAGESELLTDSNSYRIYPLKRKRLSIFL